MVTESALDGFASVHTALSEAITGLTDEQFRRRPGNGGWSVIEVLAHLAGRRRRTIDSIDRINRGDALASTEISDEKRQEEARLGRRLAPPQVIHDLIGSYRRIAMYFGRAKDESAAQSSRPSAEAYSELSRLTAHEVDHIAQIWSLRSTLLVDIPVIERNE